MRRFRAWLNSSRWLNSTVDGLLRHDAAYGAAVAPFLCLFAIYGLAKGQLSALAIFPLAAILALPWYGEHRRKRRSRP